MNKTIKIIDLLNKIANGEVVPKTILFYDREYKFDDEYKCYMHKISEDIFDDFMDNNDAELNEFLNDTVEIIEDNDKLEKIKWNEKESRAGRLRTDEEIEVFARRTETLKKKIAELVEHINKIEEKLDEK